MMCQTYDLKIITCVDCGDKFEHYTRIRTGKDRKKLCRYCECLAKRKNDKKWKAGKKNAKP